MDELSLRELITLSHQIPSATLNEMIRLFRSEESKAGCLRALKREFASSKHILNIASFIENEETLSTKEVALLLQAVNISKQECVQPDLSLVWSGPKPMGVPMRSTSQVVLEMIDNASESLFISSFAVYKISIILEYLKATVDRGVAVNMLLETPQSSHYKVRHDPLTMLSEELRNAITFFIWPYKNRVIGENGITGSLHTKFILQDHSSLFISSANLTEAAMDLNIELGILVEERDVIQRFDEQLQLLIRENVIVRV